MFTGRRYDAETSTYYYRFRNYCPMLGRFMQNDPLGYVDGMNQYAYCGNNPGNWIDPMGLWKWPWKKGGGGTPLSPTRLPAIPAASPGMVYLLTVNPNLTRGGNKAGQHSAVVVPTTDPSCPSGYVVYSSEPGGSWYAYDWADYKHNRDPDRIVLQEIIKATNTTAIYDYVRKDKTKWGKGAKVCDDKSYAALIAGGMPKLDGYGTSGDGIWANTPHDLFDAAGGEAEVDYDTDDDPCR
ncbi:MAG: RHS repeat-associated core domain-containing protein [Phycisphaerae bacterium]|nr:RHS repeat-associated core domain-containing protein [Phycisphaerae bacterium]